MKRKERNVKSKSSLYHIKQHDNLMKANHFFANKWVMISTIILLDVVICFIFNYAVNIIRQATNTLPKLSKLNGKGIWSSIDFGWDNFFTIDKKISMVYVIFFILLVIWDIILCYKIQTSYKDFNKDQKGSDRFTTIEEIKQQYKAIPLKGATQTATFEGQGGVPICEYEDKLYIDDSPVNNLFIGMTRSGKGEMIVFKMMDIYSRATEKASMIICDPKLELASAGYDTLVKRGYEVHIFNLIEPTMSMGFNPLRLIIDAYKKKDYETAEMLCSTFCYSIFNSKDSVNNENQFFNDNATFLLSALILAHTEDCINADIELNERLQEEHKIKEMAFHKLSPQEQQEVENKWKRSNELKAKIPQSSLTQKKEYEEEIKTLAEETKQYTNQPFIPSTENEQKITLYSIINTFSELGRIQVDEATTMLDFYFNTRPSLNRAKLLYASIEVAGGQKTKGSIFSTMLSKLQIFNYESIAKLTAESTFDLEKIGFGDKPIALFLGIPDYDHSKDCLASILIRQTYFVLAKKSSLVPAGKCNREVVFLLDEFGNMPAIEGMANIVTVCLGRNMRFNLVIQDYQQINSLYKDDASTIISNCGNQIYILTNDYETAEKFSNLIGKKTITMINRTGEKMSLNKSYTEMLEERPLLNANELLELGEGKCVVKRVIKRKDLKGRDIIPYAIYNHDETKFTYRYKYMLDYFPSGVLLSTVTKESCQHINPTERVFDVIKKIDELQTAGQNNGNEPPKNDLEKKNRWNQIKDRALSEIDSMVYSQQYEDLKEVFMTEWNQFIKCTPSEVYDFLKMQDQQKAMAWQNQLTSVSTTYSLHQDNESPPPEPIITTYDKDKVYINQLSNSNDVVQFIHDNVEANVLYDNEIFDELACLNLTINEVFALLPDQKKQYFNTLIERSKV